MGTFRGASPAGTAAARGAMDGLRERLEVSARLFIASWNVLAAAMHDINKEHGFYDDFGGTLPEHAMRVALIHSELSEALEAMRKGNPKDSHIPEFTGVEAEMADAVIRIMDFGVAARQRIAEAIITKTLYNNERPHRHGGKKF
jgi:hypothetical protein